MWFLSRKGDLFGSRISMFCPFGQLHERRTGDGPETRYHNYFHLANKKSSRFNIDTAWICKEVSEKKQHDVEREHPLTTHFRIVEIPGCTHPAGKCCFSSTAPKISRIWELWRQFGKCGTEHPLFFEDSTKSLVVATVNNLFHAHLNPQQSQSHSDPM